MSRHESAVVASVFMFFAGMSLFLPFLPLYVQELGDLDLGQAALWSGVILATTPAVSGVCAPAWGALADRLGRKFMLRRSLAGFAITLFLTGLAQSPWHLLVLRGVTGALGGFTASAIALLTANIPADRLTAAVGRVHTARLLGMGIGPIPGGLLADLVGYRMTCATSAALGVAAWFVVRRWVTDDSARARARGQTSTAEPKPRGRVARLPWAGLAGILTAAFLVRLVERTFDPVLPIMLTQLDRNGLGPGAATAIVTSAGLLATTAGATLASGQVRRRGHTRSMQLALGLAILGLLPLFVASSLWQVVASRIAVGLALGIAATLSFAIMAIVVAEERRGFALGVLGSVTSLGGASGYLMAGVVSAISIPTVFLGGAALIAVALVASVHQPTEAGRA